MILTPDFIDQGDQWSEALNRSAVPTADFVLLAVEILFAPGFGRHVFAELKGWPVDAVVRAEGRGKNEALHESWPSASRERDMKNIGSVGPEVGMEEIRHGRFRDLLKILLQLVFRVAPGEISIGLAKPRLRQRVHNMGASKGLRQKNYIRVLFVDLSDAPLPEWKRLGVWVIDPKDTDIVTNPIGEDITESLP